MGKDHRISIRRSRHGKRLHNDEDDNDNDSVSVTSPDTALVTVTVVQTTATSTIVNTAETMSIVMYSAQTSVSSETPNNGVIKALNETPTISPVPSSPASPGLSAGAIVGIVFAVILFLAAGGIFWFRRRSIASRLRKRKFNKQEQKPLSFLSIGPKKSSKVSSFHIGRSLTLQRDRDIASPVNTTQPTYDGLPYIPYPAPPRPPPAAGMYDVHSISDTPITTSSSKVSTTVLSPPTSPSLTASSLPLKQAETAKVRATFIPTLPDELTISLGEMVRIHVKYDDCWCLCSNARGEMGMIPWECLDMASQLPQNKSANRTHRRSVRVSSLAATSKSSYGGNTPKSTEGGNQH